MPVIGFEPATSRQEFEGGKMGGQEGIVGHTEPVSSCMVATDLRVSL